MSKHIFSDFDINNIIEKHFISMKTISDIACEYSVTHKVINRIIAQSGRIPLDFKKWTYGVIALKCAIALYKSGVGIIGISNRLEIPRSIIAAEFKRQGIKIRTQSEQEVIKWSNMSREQRIQQVQACHDATKGIKPRESTLIKIAKSRTKRTSIYEDNFERCLVDLGIYFEKQFPINKYNIDFVIGHVAVEIFGGYWHCHGNHAKRFADRTKQIFDSGYAIAILIIDKPDSFSDQVRSNFINLIQKLNLDKSSVGKYWVVWGATNTITTGCFDSINTALVNPFTNVRNGITGRYERISR